MGETAVVIGLWAAGVAVSDAFTAAILLTPGLVIGVVAVFADPSRSWKRKLLLAGAIIVAFIGTGFIVVRRPDPLNGITHKLDDIKTDVDGIRPDSPPVVALREIVVQPASLADGGDNAVQYHFVNSGDRAARVQIFTGQLLHYPNYKKKFLVSVNMFHLPNMPTTTVAPGGSTYQYFHFMIDPRAVPLVRSGQLNFWVDTLVRAEDVKTGKVTWTPICYYYNTSNRYLEAYAPCPSPSEFERGDPAAAAMPNNKGCVLHVPPIRPKQKRTNEERVFVEKAPGTCEDPLGIDPGPVIVVPDKPQRRP